MAAHQGKQQREPLSKRVSIVVMVSGLLVTVAGWAYAAGALGNRISTVEDDVKEDRAASERSDEKILEAILRMDDKQEARFVRFEQKLDELIRQSAKGD